jgi:hypothetical protein
MRDDVGIRVGDLRFRAPRILEEFFQGKVDRSVDLAEWNAHLAVGRRWNSGTIMLLLAAGLIAGAVRLGGWGWLLCVAAAVPALLAFFFLMQKKWLVLTRGEGDKLEQQVFHLWDGGEGEEELVKFLGMVLGAAKNGGEPLEPSKG